MQQRTLFCKIKTLHFNGICDKQIEIGIVFPENRCRFTKGVSCKQKGMDHYELESKMDYTGRAYGHCCP